MLNLTINQLNCIIIYSFTYLLIYLFTYLLRPYLLTYLFIYIYYLLIYLLTYFLGATLYKQSFSYIVTKFHSPLSDVCDDLVNTVWVTELW